MVSWCIALFVRTHHNVCAPGARPVGPKASSAAVFIQAPVGTPKPVFVRAGMAHSIEIRVPLVDFTLQPGVQAS